MNPELKTDEENCRVCFRKQILIDLQSREIVAVSAKLSMILQFENRSVQTANVHSEIY